MGTFDITCRRAGAGRTGAGQSGADWPHAGCVRTLLTGQMADEEQADLVDPLARLQPGTSGS